MRPFSVVLALVFVFISLVVFVLLQVDVERLIERRVTPCQVFWGLLSEVHDARLRHFVIVLLGNDYRLDYSLLFSLTLKGITFAPKGINLLLDVCYWGFGPWWHRCFSLRFGHLLVVIIRGQLCITCICLANGLVLTCHAIEILNRVLCEGPSKIFIHVHLRGLHLMINDLTDSDWLLLLFSRCRCAPRW